MNSTIQVDIADLPLEEFLKAAKEAAKIGGSELVRMLGKAKVSEKGPRDFVTEADLASQAAVERHLTTAFPNHRFLGEEDGEDAIAAMQDADADHSASNYSPFCWVVDPLDGTTNFVHQLPSFSVSIALLFQGNPIVGVVWDPIVKELFFATLGGGSHRQSLQESDQPGAQDPESLTASGCDDLSQAMVIISFNKGVTRKHAQVHSFLNLLEDAGTIRRLGSAALNLCYVAMGRSDGYWANGLKIWDVAAGALIANEAGAVIRQIDGQSFELMGNEFACVSSDKLFSQLATCLRRK